MVPRTCQLLFLLLFTMTIRNMICARMIVHEAFGR